jgi:hypothetical protein
VPFNGDRIRRGHGDAGGRGWPVFSTEKEPIDQEEYDRILDLA